MVFDQRNGKFDQVPSFKQKPFVQRVAFVRVFAVCGKFSVIRLPKTDFFCFLIWFLFYPFTNTRLTESVIFFALHSSHKIETRGLKNHYAPFL